MCRANPQEQGAASRSLLDMLAAGKEEEVASDSLMAALGGKSTAHSSAMEDQFKLPDLVSLEVMEQTSSWQEQELLKPLPRPVSKPCKYSHTHFSKEQIKLGAALQREQQKKKAEEALQQGDEIEPLQEELDKRLCKEQAKQEQVQRYARCMKEKEEQQEDKAGEPGKEGETGESGDLIIEQTGGSKPGEQRPKNPHGGKKRSEVAQEQPEEEEEEYKERMEEATRKRKVIECINPQEATEFQNFIKEKIEELVDEMKAEKDIINPV